MMNMDTVLVVNAQRKRLPHGVTGQKNNNSLVEKCYEIEESQEQMDTIADLYQEVILDHSKNPHNFGVLEQFTCTAEGNNPMCGDSLTVYIDVKDNIISDVSYRARGCAISVASASIMSSIIKGKTIEEVNILFDKFHKLCTGQTVEDDDDTEMLQVLSGVSKFPTRVKCATMSWHAMKEAIHDEKQTTLDN